MRRRLAIVAVAASAIAVTPLVAQQASAMNGADLDCTARATSTVFAAYGDTNPYYLANGGDFETTDTNWFGAGVTRVAENSSFKVGFASDRYAAQITKGGTLSAPTMCVKVDEPTVRFAYKAPGTPGAKLSVKLRTSGANGTSTNVITIDGSKAGWALTDPITLDDNTDATGTQRLSMDITSISGTWNVDDVYVDPWKRNV